MNEQANYFKENLTASETILAGDTNYCFNEFIQHTVENSVIGICLFLFVLVCALVLTNRSHEKELLIAKAGIVAILVFAMFSYPAQILPIKVCFIIYLGMIGSLTTRKKGKLSVKSNLIFKSALVISIIGIIIIHIVYIRPYFKALEDWKSAERHFYTKNYTACLYKCDASFHLLSRNGDFLTLYDKALSLDKKYEQAIDILNQACLYYPNTIVYTALGDNYSSIGLYEKAEESYLQAWYMSPVRFYPKYLLAKLYNGIGQIDKAILTARELIEKEVKVPSKAIDEIKAEMLDLITNSK